MALKISESFSWKKLLWELLFLFIFGALLFSWGAWVGYHQRPRPGHGVPTVIGNPTPAQEQGAEVVIVQSSHGHASGTLTPVTGGCGTGWNPPADSSGTAWIPPPGWSGTGEIRGEVATTITDKRGKELWSGMSPLTGSATVTVDIDGSLNLDVSFDSNQTFAVTTPEPEPKRFEVGAVAAVNTRGDWAAGGYARYNIADTLWKVGPVEVTPWAGVAAIQQTGKGANVWFMVGISGRF